MNEIAMVAPTLSNDDLIREAYISPIRTAVVVDDEFPTLEKLIGILNKDPASQAPSDDNLKRVLEIVGFCRDADRNWLLDVHDGKVVNEGKVAAHLHQCDLLILDFKLEGEEGDGRKALEILKAVSDNDHFNMVVVYTKEDVRVTYREVALSLMSPWQAVADTPLTAVDKWLADWDDQAPGIEERLLECLTIRGYLELRSAGRNKWPQNPETVAEMKDLVDTVTRMVASPGSFGQELLMKWAVRAYETKHQNEFSKGLTTGVVGVPPTSEGGVNFLRTSKIFITVVSKQKVAASELPEKLMAALAKWSPSPHRLIMAKMRNELDEHGVGAEDGALSDRHLQAGWFHDLLSADETALQADVAAAVDRQWSEMLGGVRSAVHEFSRNLIQVHKAPGDEPAEIVRRIFSINLGNEQEKREAIMRQNAYYCSMPPIGWHLTTGHILDLNSTLWLCLSPACDLVPRDTRKARQKRLKGVMPFKAVMLHPVTDKDPLSVATQNLCVFLRQGDDVKAYEFVRQHHHNPVWDEFFATDSGRLQGTPPKVDVSQLSIEDLKPSFETKTATVVSQLRYPYAINLLQRLGSYFSRVGLDFVGMSKEEES